ncbi:MAG TPA: hypothetical protein VFN22_02225 [Gemmatimonadales bacterium]|nr:hypothetical protein [Gemmatimonadales bacterium]
MTNRACSSWIVGMLLVACGTPPPTELESAPPGVSFYVSGSNGSGICGGSGEHQTGGGVDGTCYASSPDVILTAVGGGQDAIDVLDDAIAAWNVRLKEATHFNVPELV